MKRRLARKPHARFQRPIHGKRIARFPGRDRSLLFRRGCLFRIRRVKLFPLPPRIRRRPRPVRRRSQRVRHPGRDVPGVIDTTNPVRRRSRARVHAFTRGAHFNWMNEPLARRTDVLNFTTRADRDRFDLDQPVDASTDNRVTTPVATCTAGSTRRGCVRD